MTMLYIGEDPLKNKADQLKNRTIYLNIIIGSTDPRKIRKRNRHGWVCTQGLFTPFFLDGNNFFHAQSVQ